VQELLFALPVLLVSMVAHEYAHGYAALRQGDPTARDLGRLTLNPVKHIDPFLTILLPLMMLFGTGGRVVFGGAKPVPVNPRNYRHYRRGDLIVSSAGIVANLALFAVCVLLTVLLGFAGRSLDVGVVTMAQRLTAWGIWLNLLLAFFNLIPIPPLDGSHLLYHALPAAAAKRFREVGRYGALVLLAVVLFVPDVLYALLTPAFALQSIACAAVEPWALAPVPLCGL
jgi:Zn-dependent protease